MIKIYKVKWLSKEAGEAEVYLSDGYFNLMCFCHPFNQAIGDSVPQPLYTLNVKDIFILDDEEIFSVTKEEDSFDYKLTGQVINKDENQIKIGEFILELDNPLPNDVQVRDFIYL
ncbi:hypothetical protein [Flavivirga algicola]|uniref:YopX protein domain-containing protein n=1 Tax=Flavivirga algicola TaxID=2729136 RepID=A0ABX1RV08_9FLAO|nr:hypothetical protein [Flavivirga algicola]NMH87389.1 hypothetical protein [Flavivirga algicola]